MEAQELRGQTLRSDQPQTLVQVAVEDYPMRIQTTSLSLNLSRGKKLYLEFQQRKIIQLIQRDAA